MTRTTQTIALLGLGLASCTLSTKFWEFDDKAPVRSSGAPSSFRGDDFGTVMAPVSLPATLPSVGEGFVGDYLAVAGTAPSELIILRFSDGEDLEDGRLFLRYPYEFDDAFDDSGFGASLAAAPCCPGPTTAFGCIAVGVPGAGRIDIVDVAGAGASYTVSAVDSAGTTLDFIIPDPDQPYAGLVVGGEGGAAFAPGDGTGGEYLLEVPPAIGQPAAVESVSSGDLDAGTMPYLAVGSDGRVDIFRFDTVSDGYLFDECIEDPSGGFGTVLATADADGDGLEDLLIGARADTPGRYASVMVLSGDRFSGPPGPPPSSCVQASSINAADGLLGILGCADLPSRDIVCGADPAFGASIAVGDLDATPPAEIIVGAPRAEVEGKSEAGTALIFSLDPANPMGAQLLSGLRIASPSAEDHLGDPLAVLSIAGRDEVFAGMPDEGRVLLFYCSGAGEDTHPPGNRFCR
jgi:hypothetical protein